MTNTTIAAISSGVMNQPISVIRVSGPEAFVVIKKIFKGKIGTHQTITYGKIVFENKVIDEVLVAWFEGPNSYTGENLVEINAHGGIVNTKRILSYLLASGAVLALPGEFTRRAFLNGKIDLIKAEAIHELIFAKNETQADLATKKFDRQTSKLIEGLKAELVELIASIETNIDYPEYDDVIVMTNELLIPKLNDVKKQLDKIEQSSSKSKYIFEGINLAIVGKPNVGKSTLFNALIDEEKAIVTDIPGTTRDVIEAKFNLGQFLFNLQDTAGLHATKDQVEKIGIEKTLQTIEKADFVIHMLDYEQDSVDLEKWNFYDKQILNSIQNKKHLIAFNKAKQFTRNKVNQEFIFIDAKSRKIEPLITKLELAIGDINVDDYYILNNARQISLIIDAKIQIEDALKVLHEAHQVDVAIIFIRAAWRSLSNILGESTDEDLLDEMFSNFCLGK